MGEIWGREREREREGGIVESGEWDDVWIFSLARRYYFQREKGSERQDTTGLISRSMI